MQRRLEYYLELGSKWRKFQSRGKREKVAAFTLYLLADNSRGRHDFKSQRTLSTQIVKIP